MRPVLQPLTRSRRASLLAALALFLIAVATYDLASSIFPPEQLRSDDPNGQQDTFLIRPSQLAAIKSHLTGTRTPELTKLLAEADAALARPPGSVTDKTTLPPSRDRHDYISLSTYSWRDPAHPGKAVWRDGEYNPLVYAPAYDFTRLQQLVDDSEVLSLAYYYTSKEAYARKLAQVLHRWFVDPATRMNPNMRFAQVDAVGTLGSGNGIIDGWHFVYLIDAVGLIERSPHLSASDRDALKAWFRDYLVWLETSAQGRHELRALNNHALFYDLERQVFALFSGQPALARQIALYSARHRLYQITPWGSLPREESRAKPTHYMAVTAMAFAHLATVSERSGVDLWAAHSAFGGNIYAMMRRLVALTLDPKRWPGGQPPPNGEPLEATFLEAKPAYSHGLGLDGAAFKVSNQDYASDEDYRWVDLKVK